MMLKVNQVNYKRIKVSTNYSFSKQVSHERSKLLITSEEARIRNLLETLRQGQHKIRRERNKKLRKWITEPRDLNGWESEGDKSWRVSTSLALAKLLR